MLLHCDIAGQKTAYRPRFLSRDAGEIRLRGFAPLRVGSVVEFAAPHPASKEPGRARVSRCECSGDGLFAIDLEVLAE
jgi:hypothetical protein